MELDGMTKACRAKVMMKRPVTSTAAMEAMNSGVVSLGFLGSRRSRLRLAAQLRLEQPYRLFAWLPRSSISLSWPCVTR